MFEVVYVFLNNIHFFENKASKVVNNITKGTKQNPQHVIVRTESFKNPTLTVTLSKSVIAVLAKDDADQEIKKGDIVMQWADPNTKTIYIRKISNDKK